jgi:hypothetical protein
VDAPIAFDGGIIDGDGAGMKTLMMLGKLVGAGAERCAKISIDYISLPAQVLHPYSVPRKSPISISIIRMECLYGVLDLARFKTVNTLC